MTVDKLRKRIVVEEVGPSSPSEINLDEVKEKVEELQDITEEIGESVEKSAEVQHEIAQAVEVATPDKVNEVDTNIIPEIKSSNGLNPLVIIIPGLFLLGALLGGIVFYQKSLNSNVNPSPEPVVTNNIPAATPAPVPAKIDLTKYPINILNGSGISGQAGVVKNLLTTAGFTVSGTGNADTYDFTKTVIKAKSDVPSAVLSQLSAALSKSYVVDTNQSLSASSSDEIQVIVGSTKSQ